MKTIETSLARFTSLIIFLMILGFLVSCSKKAAPETEPVDDDLQGPISRPASGYGSDGSFKVSEIEFNNPLYAGTKVTVFYPTGTTSAKPTIFYSHPYGGEDKNNNRGLFEFIAKKGYVVVFVPYPTFGVSIEDRYNVLWAGFAQAATNYPNLIDKTKTGFMGHSFGGGASIGLAYKAFVDNGWGQNGRFIFTMAPWYSYNISASQLQNFPANTKLITQVYDDDVTNDHRMGIDIFKNINIPAAEKDFILIKSGKIFGYTYLSDHVLPNSKTLDAYDYYGIYRLLDAMMDYSFNGNEAAKNIALGNGSKEQISMPSYKNEQLPSLEVTDNPMPKYNQGRYEFPCGGNLNPRVANCN